MIKFKSQYDKELFVRELSEDDSVNYLISKIINEEPDSLLDAQKYITFKRKDFVTRLKNFRKSQIQKSNWRSGHYKYLKGIREFARSVEGKQFHRRLSRYLVNRGILKGQQQSNSLTNSVSEDYNSNLGFGRYDLPDLLVHLSSFRTHLMIETRYYQSMSDETDYFLLLETMLNKLSDLESRILESMISYNEFNMTEDDKEFFESIIGENLEESLEESS